MVLAGHLDTVPIADNVPSELREVDGVQRLYGCGTSDMKAGDAVMLRLAGRFGVPGAEPAHDLTFVFYDNEVINCWTPQGRCTAWSLSRMRYQGLRSMRPPIKRAASGIPQGYCSFALS